MAPKNKTTTADKGTTIPAADKDQPNAAATDETAETEGAAVEPETDDPGSPMAFAVLLMILHRELRLDEIMARFCGDPSQIDRLASMVQKRFKSAMERRGTNAADMMTGIQTVLESIGKLI